MTLPVAVDIMGGDYGPGVILHGALDSQIPVILVGAAELIRAELEHIGLPHGAWPQIEAAPEVISMEDSPASALRNKPNSSLHKAFEMCTRGKACAVVSAGNTGAMMSIGLYSCGTLPGVGRPAIAALVPQINRPPCVLIDSGANVDCHAQQLAQFAVMGSFYAQMQLDIVQPRVALLANGTEPSKGNDMTRAAASLLAVCPDIHFAGFIEGNDLLRDSADVVVCDGFVGNVLLKTLEGSAELVFESLRHWSRKSWRGRIGWALSQHVFRRLFNETLDPAAYGGAPLLGLNQLAMVCHGGSRARAIANAVRTAYALANSGLVSRLRESLCAFETQGDGSPSGELWNRMVKRFPGKKAKEA